MKPNLLGAALAALVPTSLAAAAWPAASPVRVADVLCDGRRDPVGVDRDAVRFSWMMESETRGQSQSAYTLQVASSRDALVGRPARHLGLRPRRVARERARALWRVPARIGGRLLLARARRGRGGTAHRLERAGALRHRARRRVGLGRGALDWLRGHAPLPAHGAGHPRPPRPGRAPEAQAAGHAAAAPRVRRAKARRAGAAVRERPRALRGVPQRREGGRPLPRPGLDRLRRDGPLRRVRRDGAGPLRAERLVRDRGQRLSSRRAGAVLQARGRLRLAEAPRRAAARVRGRQPRDDRHRPGVEGGAVRDHVRQHLRRGGLRRAPRARGLDRPPTSTTRGGAAPRRPRRRVAACGSRPTTRCGSWRRGRR